MKKLRKTPFIKFLLNILIFRFTTGFLQMGHILRNTFSDLLDGRSSEKFFNHSNNTYKRGRLKGKSLGTRKPSPTTCDNIRQGLMLKKL